MIKAMTSEYNVNNNGNGYAKIITLYKSFLDKTDWHDNQLLFKVYQFSSFNKYIERIYSISNFKGNNQTNTVKFNSITSVNGDESILECIYVDYPNKVDIYVKGYYDAVNVKVESIYSSNEGFYTFYNFEKFVELSSFQKGNSNILKIEPTLIGGWSKTPYFKNEIIKDNGIVTINMVLTNTSFGADVLCFKLSSEFAPTKHIHQATSYLGANGEWCNGIIYIANTGDVLLTTASITNRFPINISYRV